MNGEKDWSMISGIPGIMSLFSPLQIDLVRRLRETGITSSQITQIFNSLEALEKTLGNGDASKTTATLEQNGHGVNGNGRTIEEGTYGVDVANGELKRELATSPDSNDIPQKVPRTYSPGRNGNAETEELKPNDETSTSTPVLLSHLNGPSPLFPLAASSARPPIFPPPSRLPSSQKLDGSSGNQNPPSSIFGNPGVFSQAQTQILSQLSPAMQHMASIAMQQQRMERPMSAQERWKERTRMPRSTGIDLSSAEDVEALKELLKDGEEAAIQEIKNHANKFQLRQTAIAGMSGVSQPYISKFLNGNYRELSSRVRTTLYSWYLQNKKNPTEHIGEWERSMGFTGLKDFPGGHRRERYVFRPVLLRILESHFNRHAYPDLERRMEIAAECNQALSLEKNGLVLAKELVSPQVIANWFANKRKEFKRRAYPEPALGRAQTDPVRFPYPLLAKQFPVPGLVQPPPPAPQEEISPLPERSPPPQDDSFAAQLKEELEAVNNSVLALVNPYGDEEEEEVGGEIKANNKSQEEEPLANPFTQTDEWDSPEEVQTLNGHSE